MAYYHYIQTFSIGYLFEKEVFGAVSQPSDTRNLPRAIKAIDGLAIDSDDIA